MARQAQARWGVAIVRGRSMRPTLEEGDRLLVRYDGPVRPGRLILLRLPEGVLAVKRAAHRELGAWWVERDNVAEGVDSWSVGAIPDHDVVATVLGRLWPRPSLLRRRSRPVHDR